VNYKTCKKIQQQVFLRKLHNLNGPTLWYDWHGFEQRIIETLQMSGVTSLSVC